jgi:hypothetical protein
MHATRIGAICRTAQSRARRRGNLIEDQICPAKNKSQKSGIFLAPKNHHPKTSIPPSIHHNFTSKTPRFSTRFCQNPLQKWGSTSLKEITVKSASLRVELG